MINVLGIDPGFASLGIARVNVDPDHGDTLLWMQVITTKPSDKKRKTLAMDENLRRLGELVDGLKADIEWADVVCMESFSPPRHASAAAKIAFAWGAVTALCRYLDKPVLQCSPQHLKKTVAGARNSTKQAVQACVDQVFGEANVVAALEENGIPPSRQEHCYDAAAAVIACLDSETVKLLTAGARSRKGPERSNADDSENSNPSNQLRLRSSARRPKR